MVKNKKKLFAAVIVLTVFSVFAVTGCGEKQETPKMPATMQAEAESQTADDSSGTDEIVLTFSRDYVPIGEPLTVTAEGMSGDLTYEWYLNDRKTKTEGDTYTAAEDELESFLTVVVSDGKASVSKTMYISKLPVIYINTADGTVGDADYKDASISVQGAKGYELTQETSYDGAVGIKLRGNSTRYREKQPYKLKLEKKADLFGMGKTKHWVLLANDIDHTLIRNKLVLDFARDIGMETASESVNAVLILDGEYRGVYQLCEHVRIGKSQIDIMDWTELAEDAAEAIVETGDLSDSAKETLINLFEEALQADYSWLSEPYEFEYKGKTYTMTDYVEIPALTGGFLLEADFYNIGAPNSVMTNYQQPFYFNTPENGQTNAGLRDYVRKFLQSFEYALHSPDFTYHEEEQHYLGSGQYFDREKGWIGREIEVDYSDPERDGMHYSEFFDVDSLVQNFFVCEFSRNWDSMKNSVFLYKDIDGLAYMGPVWDFDWAFGNINMFWINTNAPTGWQTTDDAFTVEQYYQSQQWNRYLIKDPEFVQKVYEKWQEIRPTVIEDIIKEGGLLDSYREELREAGKMNDVKWSYTYNSYGSVGYEESWDNLNDFIRTRIAWLDEQFTDFDTLYESLNAK